MSDIFGLGPAAATPPTNPGPTGGSRQTIPTPTSAGGTLQVQAEAIRTAFDRAVTDLRNDTRITADVRQSEIAVAYLDSLARMNALRAAYASGQDQAMHDLERRVFAAPAIPASADATARLARDTSYRDALERAERCADEGEALALLQRADRIGDEALAKAVAVIAVERQWSGAINQYTATRPEFGEPLRDLARLRSIAGNPRDKFTLAMVLTLSKPTEISAMDTWQIQSLADRVATA